MNGTFPLPDTSDPATAPFWQAAARGELALPRRISDGEFDWYPTGAEVDWVTLSGTGTLFSWAVVSRPLHPGLAAIAPYTSALVELDGAPGVRLVTRLLGDPAALAPAIRVQARFVDLGYPSLQTYVLGPLFEPI